MDANNTPVEFRLVTHTSTVSNALARTATLDGRQRLVIPAVMLVAGVVNNMLVEAEELMKFPAAWNGRPVTIRHPQAGGEYISANAPQVIEKQAVGQVFNAHVDGNGKLAGELWIDVEKCKALGGIALTTLRRLESGQPVEVSSAYFCDVVPAPGQYNNQQYIGIQRNLRPDHLALLPDEQGACSWRDGCGAPRVNLDQSVEGDEQMNKEVELNERVESVEENSEVVKENFNVNGEQADTNAAERVATKTEHVPDDLTQLSKIIGELGGVEKVASLLRGLAANAESRREELISALAANSACAFSAEELRELSIEHLEKLHRSLTPNNYAGRPAISPGGLSDGEIMIGYEVFRPYQGIEK